MVCFTYFKRFLHHFHFLELILLREHFFIRNVPLYLLFWLCVCTIYMPVYPLFIAVFQGECRFVIQYICLSIMSVIFFVYSWLPRWMWSTHGKSVIQWIPLSSSCWITTTLNSVAEISPPFEWPLVSGRFSKEFQINVTNLKFVYFKQSTFIYTLHNIGLCQLIFLFLKMSIFYYDQKECLFLLQLGVRDAQ